MKTKRQRASPNMDQQISGTTVLSCRMTCVLSTDVSRRALGERHVNMIAFSSTIGIGCFLQGGKVIHLIGPGGAVL